MSVPLPLRVEIARTPEEHRRGLAGRTDLADGHGMLFVVAADTDQAFWNAGTLVPLSLAFLDAGGRIHTLHDMMTIGESVVRVTYRPAAPWRYALEVPRGWFQRAGLRVGDRFDLRAVGVGGAR